MKFTSWNEGLKAELDAVAKERGLRSGRDLIADFADPKCPCLICLQPMGSPNPHCSPTIHPVAEPVR